MRRDLVASIGCDARGVAGDACGVVGDHATIDDYQKEPSCLDRFSEKHGGI
jgi:hypothetical protein